MLRMAVILPGGSAGALASTRSIGGRVTAVRVNVGRHLTDWIDVEQIRVRPTRPA